MAVLPRRPYRHLRFTLRSLLLALTAVALVFGVWINRGQRQTAAVHAIQRDRAQVSYDYQFRNGTWSSTEYDANGASPFPQWLVKALGPDYFHRVIEVHLFKSESLPHLERLNGLEAVIYRTAHATDDDLRYLAALPELRYIKIRPTYVFLSDSALPAGFGHITDQGLERLGAATKLATIDLHMEEVTDAGLNAIGKMPSIQNVNLRVKCDDTTQTGRDNLRTSRNLAVLEIVQPPAN